VHLPARPRLSIGDKVRITGGALAGCEGLYAGMGVRQREIVLLQILGAAREVAVDADLIQAAS
jgi:hypothetical protein